MAKFGEKLLDFKEVSKFFRIPVSCWEDKSFLNVGKNSVVKVHDQKPLHTWTLMHPHHFTSPVVYSGGSIHCVMDNHVLMRWSADEDNLMNAQKIQFQESIFCVIPMEGEKLLVLFSAGKYAIIDTTTFDVLELSNFVFLKENEELIWADASETTKDFEVFCLAYNKKAQKRTVYYFTVSKEDKTASNLSMKNLSHEEATLKAWCLNHQDSSFLSLWSNGTVYCHNVKNSKDSELLFFKNIDANNTIVDIQSIDCTHILVARGSLKQKECVLEIWDSKCAVLKARKVLKTASLTHIQVVAMGSQLFLCHNEELISVAFHVENPTLSAAVGKSSSENNKVLEYSWDTKAELLQVPSIDEPEAMEVCDRELSNKVDSIEAIAQKLLNKKSYLLYIQESELVKHLQLVVRCKKEESDHENNSTMQIYSILNIIFSASFNDILLVMYLRNLSLEEVLIALELLLSYLNHTVQLPSDISDRPSDLQIVNWTTLIIQSHVEDLLFSKDKMSRRLLKQFKKALSMKIEEYEDFESIKQYFSVIENKNILPQNCSVGTYCVESIDI